MRRAAVALVLAALVVPVVAGCSASVPRSTPTPRAAFTPNYFSGTLSGENEIRIPLAAHSAVITVVCSGSRTFTLDGALNQTVSGLSGTCNGGLHSYQLPTEPTRTLKLTLELDSVGSFVVETRFFAPAYVPDSEQAKQCSTMVTVASDAFNAEDGYRRGAVSLAQWQHRIATAAHALRALDSEKPNILSSPLKTVSDALDSPTASPGAFLGGDYGVAMSVIRQVCEDGGHATYINAEFGG